MGGRKKKATEEEGAEAAEKKPKAARPKRDTGPRADLTKKSKGGGAPKGPKRGAIRESKGG